MEYRFLRVLLGVTWALSLAFLCFFGFAAMAAGFDGDEMSAGVAGAMLVLAWIVYRRWSGHFLGGKNG